MSVNTKVNGQLVPSAGLYSVTKPIGMADIYSTEEKEVGLWIDNKPLYAKTINFGALPNNTTKEVAHGISNLDAIANVYGVAKSQYNQIGIPWVHNANVTYGVCMYVDDTNVVVMTSSDRSGYTDSTITILYTKTTDTPWSGKFVPQGYGYVSSGDIYSFEERQVGVWSDGKPLYQKTVSCGTLPNNTTKEIEHGISNIDDVANIFVVAKNPTSGVWQNVPTVNTTNLNQQIQAWISGTKVHIRSAINYSAYTSCYVTIQYTKTTDVAGSGEYVPSGDKAVHYSTEEEVIGTWFGETLYRKVFNFTNPTAGSNSIQHNISNFGKLINVYGNFSRQDGYDEPIPMPTANDTFVVSLVDFTSTTCTLKIGSVYAGTYALTDVSVVVEYTKTS